LAETPKTIEVGFDVANLKEFRDLARRLEATRFVLAEREAELMELKGPCSVEVCRLHFAHKGPCDIRGA
jgi:hypothetical protein